MSDASWLDYELSSLGPDGSPPIAPTVLLPMAVVAHTEQSTTLCFMGLLLLLLLFLLVRCIRILLDPYSSMPASSWNDHKDGLERGTFDFALV